MQTSYLLFQGCSRDIVTDSTLWSFIPVRNFFFVFRVFFPPAECAGKFDITLVLDSSNAVGLDGFNKVKTFAGQLVDAFNIGDTKFAVITSGKSTKIDFMFNTLKGGALSKDGIKSRIEFATFQGGDAPDIGRGLGHALDEVFKTQNGARLRSKK
ncbi:predicted protein, partial [Nematostella vectensis]